MFRIMFGVAAHFPFQRIVVAYDECCCGSPECEFDSWKLPAGIRKLEEK